MITKANPAPTTSSVKTTAKAAFKTPSKVSGKSAQKSAAPAAVKPGKVAKASKPGKPVKIEKPKKPKLIRDSFTIPKAEYELLDVLKARAIRLKRPAKKSELLRAGVKLLVGLTDAAFLTAMQAVPALKTGRPGAVPEDQISPTA